MEQLLLCAEKLHGFLTYRGYIDLTTSSTNRNLSTMAKRLKEVFNERVARLNDLFSEFNKIHSHNGIESAIRRYDGIELAMEETRPDGGLVLSKRGPNPALNISERQINLLFSQIFAMYTDGKTQLDYFDHFNFEIPILATDEYLQLQEKIYTLENLVRSKIASYW